MFSVAVFLVFSILACMVSKNSHNKCRESFNKTKGSLYFKTINMKLFNSVIDYFALDRAVAWFRQAGFYCDTFMVDIKTSDIEECMKKELDIVYMGCTGIYKTYYVFGKKVYTQVYLNRTKGYVRTIQT